MRRLAVFTILTLAILLSGCMLGGVAGSGVRKSEKRDVGSFKAIETSGAFDVEVICQKSASLEVEGDDNLLPLIQTEVRDGVLHVTTTKGYHSSAGIALRISLPNLESLKSTGAGKFRISNLKNDKFKIDSSGAASITASGDSKSIEIDSTGVGEVDAHNLHAEKAEVSVTGAASVDVNASDELDVSVAGAGHVTYSGNPKVTKRVSGAGEVTKKEGTGA
jgi:Putative auto-transporter adhesin, head GIN domain